MKYHARPALRNACTSSPRLTASPRLAALGTPSRLTQGRPVELLQALAIVRVTVVRVVLADADVVLWAVVGNVVYGTLRVL